jgi:hypothetical protein
MSEWFRDAAEKALNTDFRANKTLKVRVPSYSQRQGISSDIS